jgi:hypothetical protein
MDAVNSLPGKSSQVGPDGFWFFRTFKNLSHGNGTDPKVSRGVTP